MFGLKIKQVREIETGLFIPDWEINWRPILGSHQLIGTVVGEQIITAEIGHKITGEIKKVQLLYELGNDRMKEMDFETNLTQTISDLLNQIKALSDRITNLEIGVETAKRIVLQYKELYDGMKALENRTPEKITLIGLIKDLFKKK